MKTNRQATNQLIRSVRNFQDLVCNTLKSSTVGISRALEDCFMAGTEKLESVPMPMNDLFNDPDFTKRLECSVNLRQGAVSRTGEALNSIILYYTVRYKEIDLDVFNKQQQTTATVLGTKPPTVGKSKRMRLTVACAFTADDKVDAKEEVLRNFEWFPVVNARFRQALDQKQTAFSNYTPDDFYAQVQKPNRLILSKYLDHLEFVCSKLAEMYNKFFSNLSLTSSIQNFDNTPKRKAATQMLVLKQMEKLGLLAKLDHLYRPDADVTTGAHLKQHLDRITAMATWGISKQSDIAKKANTHIYLNDKHGTGLDMTKGLLNALTYSEAQVS